MSCMHPVTCVLLLPEKGQTVTESTENHWVVIAICSVAELYKAPVDAASVDGAATVRASTLQWVCQA